MHNDISTGRLLHIAMTAAIAFGLAGCFPAEPAGPEPLNADAGPDRLIAAEQGVTLTAEATGGAPPYLYRWSLQQQPANAEVMLPEGLTDPTLEIESFDLEGRYVFRVRITDSAGTTDTSFVTISVGGQLEVTASTDAQLRIVGETAQLGVIINSSTTGLEPATVMWEVVRGTAEIDDPTIRNPQVTVQASETIELKVRVTAEAPEAPFMGTSGVVLVGVPSATPRVAISNSGGVEGDIVLELLTEEAPNTVANFLHYVDDGFYDGILWHRVGQNDEGTFVIQGGLFERVGDELDPKDELLRDPIPSEAPNGESNVRLTMAMALRGQDANSATSQFFINVTDNEFLDAGPPPFTVFARVVEGADIVDDIAASEFESDPVAGGEVPVEDIVMTIRRQ